MCKRLYRKALIRDLILYLNLLVMIKEAMVSLCLLLDQIKADSTWASGYVEHVEFWLPAVALVI